MTWRTWGTAAAGSRCQPSWLPGVDEPGMCAGERGPAPTMTWTCSECSASNPVGTRFCGYCGSSATSASPPLIVREAAAASAPSLPSIPDQPAAGGESVEERRLVTAVFADLSGFTALADRLDADELHEIIGPLISRLAAVAERV